MPLTFIDIERRKTWRIGLYFLVLLFLYAAITAVLASTFMIGPQLFSPKFWTFVALVSAIVAGIHFWFSASDTVNTVVRTLDAQPPDREDAVHKVLQNVLDEIHVVTGNKRTIRGFVIPSLSLNALAAADLNGNAMIGITEGLLSRLTRPQLEAVLAHEAHHVLSGDCLETTVAASLFGAVSSVVEKLGRASRGRVFSSPAYLLAWLLLMLSHLLHLFISREREYRADAASVRMTRNPLALAEALHLLSRSWRGAGFIGSGLEMLCVVNPRVSALDETEGLVAELLSTHPPIGKRISVLLGMARVSLSELDEKAAVREREHKAGSGASVETPKYYAASPRQEWLGPFAVSELAALPWLSPLTWITTGGAAPVERAWKDPLVNALFTAHLSAGERPLSPFACPVCRQPLILTQYENTQVHQCAYCSGALVENAKIARILARTSGPSPERVHALTRALLKENRSKTAEHRLRGKRADLVPLLKCPKCSNPMGRNFYSMAYLVEVDRCSFCGLTWFDQDELGMLQCMISNRLAGDPLASSRPAE